MTPELELLGECSASLEVGERALVALQLDSALVASHFAVAQLQAARVHQLLQFTANGNKEDRASRSRANRSQINDHELRMIPHTVLKLAREM